jgi:hypothetical protein
MEYPFVGYAPDIDQTTLGVITDCQGVVPSVKGMRSAPSAQLTTLPALATTARGGAAVRKLDDSSRLIVGTAGKLWEAGLGSYTDVSRTAGGSYSCATDDLWTFAQFGNITIAGQKADFIQASTAGNFATVSTAPKASIVETVGQFAFAFDTTDSSFGDSPDRWWCSAIGDYSSWTPSVSTQSASGRFLAGEGKVTCAKRFGERIVAFKRNATYIGSYVGAPFVWDWQQAQGNIGCIGKYAAVDVGTAKEPRLLFMGSDNFYAFDGARNEPIGDALRETVFSELSITDAEICSVSHDRTNGLVYFFYPKTSSALCNACVVYNYRTGKWGRSDMVIQTALEFISPGLTYDGLGALYSTYDNMPDVTYDSAIWIAQKSIPAVIDNARFIRTLDGSGTSAYMTLGLIGSDQAVTTIKRVTPRWLTKPESATLGNFIRSELGEEDNADGFITMSAGRFDLMRRSKWHRFRIGFTGTWELPGINIEVKEGGKE